MLRCSRCSGRMFLEPESPQDTMSLLCMSCGHRLYPADPNERWGGVMTEGSPHPPERNMRGRKPKLGLEEVRKVQQMIRAGVRRDDIAVNLGVSMSIIARIARGVYAMCEEAENDGRRVHTS
jgi:hypothetical protein